MSAGGWRTLSLPVLRFELSYQLRRAAFWIVALLFGGIGFVDMVSNGGRGNAFFFGIGAYRFAAHGSGAVLPAHGFGGHLVRPQGAQRTQDL